MEIERKFLINEFPDNLPLVSKAEVYQGYISVNPVVRIRKTVNECGEEYILCFKGAGTIARQETEIKLEKSTFQELEKLLRAPMIHKGFRVYRLPDGLDLECSRVDAGRPSEFMYAEIEFDTLEQALSYQPPEFLSNEVTHDRKYGMASYWLRKMQDYID